MNTEELYALVVKAIDQNTAAEKKARDAGDVSPWFLGHYAGTSFALMRVLDAINGNPRTLETIGL